MFLNGPLNLRIAVALGGEEFQGGTNAYTIFIINHPWPKITVITRDFFFLGKDEKPEWNLQGFEKTKHEATGTCAFYLKRIHRVTSRHQKIRVDENRVGGTCFVRLYSFP